MIEETFVKERSVRKEIVKVDFFVAGGGLAGVCAAISAARQGVKVALVQDRPVLGGNASSEVRLWALGATSHMGNNNRWAREGGIINEILVENTFRNKEGNPVIFDTVLLDQVLAEKNITLYLNTIVLSIKKEGERKISEVVAYNPQNETLYQFSASYYCDSTGDGLLAYLAGATYRSGAEDAEEFDEKFAPNKATYGEKLGHTIFFYIKDTGRPVKYVAPHFAMSMDEVKGQINRIANPEYFTPKQTGCKYWWIEYGGRLDTIKDTEDIKYKLWSVLYGIWNYVKNSGEYPEMDNYTLEWAGTIPGKRESRRFVGYYMLQQRDIVEQRYHYDAVAFGGWSLDLHPADGVFSEQKKACNQWHSKGVYPIPYRCFVTPDLDNLFFAGRIMSASHVAFASARVMVTSAAGGDAVGAAAAFCVNNGYTPADLLDEKVMCEYQKTLIQHGIYLPQMPVVYSTPLLEDARISVSSELCLEEIPFDGAWRNLSQSAAQMLPFSAGKCPTLTLQLKAHEATTLTIGLRISSKNHNHTPDVILEEQTLRLEAGEQMVRVKFETEIPHTCYGFVCLMKNEEVEVRTSESRITGIVSVFNKILPAVSNWGKQVPLEDIGVEEFEFWCPERRPEGHNIAMKIEGGLTCFGKENLRSSDYRPVEKPNAWVASLDDKDARITLSWSEPRNIHELVLFTDVDYDHPMESVQWGHNDSKMPFCVDTVEVYANGSLIGSIEGNYQVQIKLGFDNLSTDQLEIRLKNSSTASPVSLFNLQIL